MNPDRKKVFQQNTVLVCMVIWSALTIAALIMRLVTRQP